VFWTRTSESAKQRLSMSEEEKQAAMEARVAKGDEEQNARIDEALSLVSYEDYMAADMPERTITTEPYYTDVIVTVKKKPEAK